MRDRSLIWSGLVLFLALVTLPVWQNLRAHVTAKGPGQVLPPPSKQCVAPVAFMRTSHMTLLLDWRNNKVRQSASEYKTADGRHYAISLSNTCLRECHTEKDNFCDRCHNYAAVNVPCWDCHTDSKTLAGRAR